MVEILRVLLDHAERAPAYRRRKRAEQYAAYRQLKRAESYRGLRHGISTNCLGCKCSTCRSAGSSRKALWRERTGRH